MKILLWGWNGKRNLGDDLMTYCIVNYIKRVNPLSEIYIFGDHSRLPKELSYSTKAVPGYNVIKFVPRIRMEIYSWFYPKYFAKKMDLIIIGGGSIFSNINSMRFYKLMADAVNDSNRSGNVISVSTSIGPFKNSNVENAFLELLSSLNKFSVRDQRSFEYLKSNLKGKKNAKIQVAPDVAFTLPLILDPGDIIEEENTIGISIVKGAFSIEKETIIINSLKKVLDAYPDKILKIFCFFNSNNTKISDIPLAKFYSQNLRNFEKRIKIVPYKSDFNNFISQVVACRHFISIRLHSAIIRFSYRRNFFILPYHQKCYDLVNDLGVGKAFLLEDIHDGSFIDVINLNEKMNADFICLEESKKHLSFIKNYLEVKNSDDE